MFEKKDYSNLSTKELLIEESHIKKTRKVIIIFAVIGMIATFIGIYKNDLGFINAISPLVLILVISRYGSVIKRIESELKTRNDNL